MRDAHRAVRGAAIISDGIAVTGGSEGILRTWDVTSGKEVGPRLDRTLLGGIRTVTAVGDGTVAAGTEAGTIVLWNPASGDVGEIIGHRGRVWAASAFGDGRLATVAFDRTLRIWNLGSGAELARAADPLGASWGLAVIDGEHLAAASPIGVIRVAKVVDLSVAGSAHLTSAAVSLCVTTSGDRTYVVVGGDASKPTFLVLDLLRLAALCCVGSRGCGAQRLPDMLSDLPAEVEVGHGTLFEVGVWNASVDPTTWWIAGAHL